MRSNVALYVASIEAPKINNMLIRDSSEINKLL
jgi:hypothetical protein